MQYRRKKYGITTKGIVLSKWMEDSLEENGRDIHYYITFEFRDTRKVVTVQYILIILNEWHLDKDIPVDIINLIADHIGHSYFYYGPFQITRGINEAYFNQYDDTDDIPIRYDPKYPLDAEIEHNEGCCVSLRACLISMGAVGFMFGFGWLFLTEFPFDNAWNGSNGTLIIIIGVSVILNICCCCFIVYRRKLKLMHKLSIEREEIPRVISDHPCYSFIDLYI